MPPKQVTALEPAIESVTAATERAIRAASHLTDLDAGAVAALRRLASLMDELDPKDNVTIPTYLKYCDALKLTPASRGVEVTESKARGKLATMRAARSA